MASARGRPASPAVRRVRWELLGGEAKHREKSTACASPQYLSGVSGTDRGAVVGLRRGLVGEQQLVALVGGVGDPGAGWTGLDPGGVGTVLGSRG